MKLFILRNVTILIVKIIKLLKKGNGYTLPGYIILKLFPTILKDKTFSFKKGIVVVSGTNGKTTTTKLISDIFKANGLRVTHNSSGSNLLRGIATALVMDLDFWGRVKTDVAVLEVDEFALSQVLDFIDPRVLVLLNLSRDQLDRYGETDTILSRWIHSLEILSTKTTLILDSTQPILSVLKSIFKGPTESFNSFSPQGLSVKESFNIKNVNAALKVCSLYKISLSKCLETINKFEYAYGRGEELTYEGNTFKLYLAKNPASFNNNLEMLLEGAFKFDSLLFILNDGLPDGRDVSWIYDIDTQLLERMIVDNNITTSNIYISGTRCFDMATRLFYAGVPVPRSNINISIKDTLSGVSKSPSKIVVLPNYYAMLDFRSITLGRNIL
jgi:UDP-N-acetylmuramyl tripeptide synthase